MNYSNAVITLVFITIVFGYLIGSILFSKIFSKIYKKDVQQLGSKNPGATNTVRVLGLKPGIGVMVCDMFKIVLATMIVWIIYYFGLKQYLDINLNVVIKFNPANIVYLTGLFGILGHIFPIYFNFKGGKGVASSFGWFLTISPFIFLIGMIVMVIVVKIKKYVSLGSMISVSVMTLLTLIPGINYIYLIYPNITLINNLYINNYMINLVFSFGVALVICAIVIIKHKENIIRINNKTESIFKINSTKNIKTNSNLKGEKNDIQ